MKWLVVFSFLLSACVSAPKLQEKEVPTLIIEKEPEVEVVKPEEKIVIKEKKKVSKATAKALVVEKPGEVIAVPSYPFEVGEKVEYRAYLRSLEVGTASFEIKPTNKGHFNFVFTLQTTGMISKFYYLKIRQESYTDSFLRPLKFLSYSRENNREKKVYDEYDHKKKEVVTNLDGESKTLDFSSVYNSFNDTLSALYRLRAQGEGSGHSLVDGQMMGFKIKKQSSEGKWEKFSVDIEGKEPQYIWVDENKKIQKILIKTSAGEVTLK